MGPYTCRFNQPIIHRGRLIIMVLGKGMQRPHHTQTLTGCIDATHGVAFQPRMTSLFSQPWLRRKEHAGVA
jgi:hypothetical protein